MGDWITIETPHGHVGAWREPAAAPSRGQLVLVQEIFGVNSHIRDVAGRLAAAGFDTLAPCLFDPVEPRAELAYDDAGVRRGRELAAGLGFERAVDIIGAAARHQGDPDRPVAVMGFCWGGTLALLANTRLGLPGVSYYGGRSVPFLDEALRAPMLLHFGERDPIIPPEHIALHREKLVGARIHVHAAGHGFNCDQRSDFEPEAAAAAWKQSLDFLYEVLV